MALYPAQRRGQAFQLVQVHRKADGVCAGGEPLHQVVVAAALEHRAGDARHVPGEHKAVVIFHLVRHAQIQLGAAAILAQGVLKGLQFVQGVALGVAQAGGAGFRQRRAQRAVQVKQPGQCGGCGVVQPGIQRSR